MAPTEFPRSSVVSSRFRYTASAPGVSGWDVMLSSSAVGCCHDGAANAGQEKMIGAETIKRTAMGIHRDRVAKRLLRGRSKFPPGPFLLRNSAIHKRIVSLKVKGTTGANLCRNLV